MLAAGIAAAVGLLAPIAGTPALAAAVEVSAEGTRAAPEPPTPSDPSTGAAGTPAPPTETPPPAPTGDPVASPPVEGPAGDTGATLTLRARVDNTDGGAAAATAWALGAAGPTRIHGITGASETSGVPVEPGVYALSSTGPLGYGPPRWTCDGGSLDGTTVAVDAGAAVVCTASQDDLPVDLALTLDDGDARAANGGTFDITMTVRNVGERDVDPDEPVTVTATLPAGTALVDRGGCTATGSSVACEIAPLLLTAGGAAVLSMTLRFDDDARPGDFETLAAVQTTDDPAPEPASCASASNGVDCEVTELRYPTLTLQQEVANDDGGEAAVTDFALTATGPLHIGGPSGSPVVTSTSIPAGAYRLGITEVAGYASGPWSCVGGALADGTVTVAGTGDVTCTVVSDDRAVDLQLTADDRDVVVAAGGEATFGLTVTNIGARGLDPGEPATISAVLPAGLDYLGGGSRCSSRDGTVTCVIHPDALPAGAAVTVEIEVAVAPGLDAGSYRTEAVVTTDDDPGPGPGSCERPSNNVACQETAVGVGSVTAQTSVWEQVSGGWLSSDGAVGFGDLVQFRILVRAGGDAPSTGVGIVDQLPGGLLPEGTASCSVPCTAVLDAATGTHRVEIGTMEPGATVTVTISARVPGVPSQADGTTVRVDFDSAAAVSSDTVASESTNMVTVRASHALPPRGPTGGQIPIGGLSMALALLVAGGLLLVRSRELASR